MQAFFAIFQTHPMAFEIAVFAISLLAGIIGAILGIGGGILIVPALTIVFGVNIRFAIGASIVSVIATSSGAAAAYVRDKITNIRLGIFLEVATTIGALVGFFLASYAHPKFLYFLFAGILTYSAFVMLIGRSFEVKNIPPKEDPLAIRLKVNGTYPERNLGKNVSYKVYNVAWGFVMMLGAGIVSGLLGIGSGILKVPAMDTVMKLPIKVSSATSNFMIGVTAAASAAAYLMKGEVLPVLVAPVALGVIGGSWVGAKIMVRLQGARIRQAFIVVLIITAIQMGFKAFNMKGGG